MIAARPWVRSKGRTEICFRYIAKRKPRRAYDIFIVLLDDPRFGEIDIRHAAPSFDDMPALTSGYMSVARLRTVLDLTGLIERVISKDHSPDVPGALVAGARLSFPFQSPASIGPPAERAVTARRSRYPARRDVTVCGMKRLSGNLGRPYAGSGARTPIRFARFRSRK
jgi:hypothetical protein